MTPNKSGNNCYQIHIEQELKALLDPEFSNITTFLELFG